MGAITEGMLEEMDREAALRCRHGDTAIDCLDCQYSEAEKDDLCVEESDKLSFGAALVHLKCGERVARRGWNGKGMWFVLVNPDGEGNGQPGSTAAGWWSGGVCWDLQKGESPAGAPRLLPWIGMKTADNGFVPWLASQTDILAEDWEVLV